jgi:large subunit ribosomal protein L32
MAVPKRRLSKAKTRSRRSHDALKSPAVSVCPSCHEPKRPHRVCPKCGTYRGKQVKDVKGE